MFDLHLFVCACAVDWQYLHVVLCDCVCDSGSGVHCGSLFWQPPWTLPPQPPISLSKSVSLAAVLEWLSSLCSPAVLPDSLSAGPPLVARCAMLPGGRLGVFWAVLVRLLYRGPYVLWDRLGPVLHLQTVNSAPRLGLCIWLGCLLPRSGNRCRPLPGTSHYLHTYTVI